MARAIDAQRSHFGARILRISQSGSNCSSWYWWDGYLPHNCNANLLQIFVIATKNDLLNRWILCYAASSICTCLRSILSAPSFQAEHAWVNLHGWALGSKAKLGPMTMQWLMKYLVVIQSHTWPSNRVSFRSLQSYASFKAWGYTLLVDTSLW